MRERWLRSMAWVGVALGLLGAAPQSPQEHLARAEQRRIDEVLAWLERGGPPAERAARAAARARDEHPCGAAGSRLVLIATAAELTAALATARPGDHLQLAPGTYRGRFVAERSGSAERPITLCGPRAAVLEAGTVARAYGLHLDADHWSLVGFSVRGARKGIVLDGASHNVLRGLEVHQIGEEGVHFRGFSRSNRIEGCWIHDVGLISPEFGEGVYIGSARSNWDVHSDGGPDSCDGNAVLGNVLGPGVPAEGVDAKEGTRAGTIAGNVFLGGGRTHADSWVDVKGNGYTVRDNRGTHDPTLPFDRPVTIHAKPGGWGAGNLVGEHASVAIGPRDGAPPFRAMHAEGGSVTLALPGRTLPYALDELLACFPQALEQVAPGVFLLREHLLAGPGARLEIRARDVRELRLRSEARSFTSVIGVRCAIEVTGTPEHRVWIRSWDPRQDGPDRTGSDGRAYVSMFAGRMDLDRAQLTDLGYYTGWCSGASWKGDALRRCRGSASRSIFARNHFGAYTFEADSMRWTDNEFAHNIVYGFDPHDNSDHFVVTGNRAHHNLRHGIIFSRGCRGNLLRGNRCYSNGGHGIMLDDGHVADDGNPRHAASVPPTANQVVENEVWGNDVGIALQGGLDNSVRANVLRGNRFGIRLDQSDRNRCTENVIRGSREFAVHLFGGSDGNRIVGNTIHGGRAGIVVLHSLRNVIERNSITGIVGRGIQVAGASGPSVISGNRIAGRGARAIETAPGSQVPSRPGNVTVEWLPRRDPLPGLLLWSTILGMPVLMGLRAWGRRRKREARGRVPIVGAVLATALFAAPGPGRAAPGQTLSVTASFAAVRDDNVFKYSDTQLGEIAAGTSGFRYGVTRPEDVVLGPGLALQWQQQLAEQRRRSLRLRGEGTVHGRHGSANFGELDATWRESFTGARRLSLGLFYAPDRLLRRLHDGDLTALPSTERYRDARYDARGGSVAWRHAVPRATWLEWSYKFDRRRFDPGFRERDSDFHTSELEVGWDELPRGGQLHVRGGHNWRFARAEDGDPSEEPDLSHHGPEAGVDGRLDLGALGDRRWFGDAGYGLERRVHDSDRVNDTANRGRRDVVQSLELGVGLEHAGRWSARAFYRVSRCRAHLATSASLDSELGSYDQDQLGITLQWTNELRRGPRMPAPRQTR